MGLQALGALWCSGSGWEESIQVGCQLLGPFWVNCVVDSKGVIQKFLPMRLSFQDELTLFYFGLAACRILNFQIEDRTHAPWSGVQSPNYWTPREFLSLRFLDDLFSCSEFFSLLLPAKWKFLSCITRDKLELRLSKGWSGQGSWIWPLLGASAKCRPLLQCQDLASSYSWSWQEDRRPASWAIESKICSYLRLSQRVRRMDILFALW